MPISEYKDSLTLLRSKQQSHYVRGQMKYQSHFLLASVIKENLVAWLFMLFFFPSFKKKAILMEWKGGRFWRSRLRVNFLLITLFSAFRKENPNQFSSSPLYLMLNSSRTTTKKRDVKHIALRLEWGKLLPYYCYRYEY